MASEYPPQDLTAGAILTSCGEITKTHQGYWGDFRRLSILLPLFFSGASYSQQPAEVVAPLRVYGAMSQKARLPAALAEALRAQGFAKLSAELGQLKPGPRFVWPYPQLMTKGLSSTTLSQEQLARTRYSQPTICSFKDHMAVFLERGTLLDHRVGQISYRILPIADPPSAIVAALATLQSAAWPNPPRSPLRLSLSSYPARRAGIPTACWNLAFIAEAQELHASFVSIQGGAYRQQVIRALGGEALAKPRPHFQVMAYWQAAASKSVHGRLSTQSAINGQQVNLAWSAVGKNALPSSASSLGQGIESATKTSPGASAENRATIELSTNLAAMTFQVGYPADWTSFLQREAGRLNRLTPPRIVARYGTWAYLDRGRGYGITINQRFVGGQRGSSRTGAVFAGHVVKFFGPSEGLKDASGQPIADGAIIYLRTGRDEAVIGMPVFPDQATYP